MRIFDELNNEVFEPDMALGYLKEDKMLVAHHAAVEAVAESGHYRTIARYPNGGKDVEWVIDVPAVVGMDAWDEYEEIQRYVLYTEEELATLEQEKNAPTQLDRVEAQVMYTALMTDTLLEDDE